MIAFEGMTKVNQEAFKYVPSTDWNWKPEVEDLEEMDRDFIQASGSSTTSKSTFSTQRDHGEYDWFLFEKNRRLGAFFFIKRENIKTQGLVFQSDLSFLTNTN